MIIWKLCWINQLSTLEGQFSKFVFCSKVGVDDLCSSSSTDCQRRKCRPFCWCRKCSCCSYCKDQCSGKGKIADVDLFEEVLIKIVNAISYLPTFKFQKEEQMREKNLKRGTFLNFLYITIQRLLQKQEHMIKSFSFLLRKEELFLQKRNSWQVCHINEVSNFIFSICLSFHTCLHVYIIGIIDTLIEQNAPRIIFSVIGRMLLP